MMHPYFLYDNGYQHLSFDRVCGVCHHPSRSISVTSKTYPTWVERRVSLQGCSINTYGNIPLGCCRHFCFHVCGFPLIQKTVDRTIDATMDAHMSVASMSTSSSAGFQSDWITSFSPTSISGPVLLGLFLGYVSLCSLLRFSRINSLVSKLGFHDRASLGRMTNQNAFEIVKTMANLEFPLMYDLATRLALFEVCPID